MVSVQLAVQTMASYAASLELARWAEQEGLAGFAVADHYLAGGDSTYALDQLAVLAAVATGTEQIPLSTLVSPVTFRHPAVMWKTAVTIDEISRGRFSLGVGAAWMEEEHEMFGLDFPEPGQRFEWLSDALAYLTALRSGDESGFQGNHYRLAAGPSPEPHGESVRLIVGGSGPRRTPELAGRFADEFNVFPSRHSFGPRIEKARAAAEQVGRDPDRILISTAFPLVVGADESDLDERISRIAASRGSDPERIRSRWPEVGIPVGVPDVYHTGLEALAAEGIERVYLQVAFDSLEEIRRLVGLLKS
jgi:alkanesulfonate monooxygenase SsuD/methylene tetrahydromethanopterin reductase-like flavin-dependent oxidoreductase (luciferase family)